MTNLLEFTHYVVVRIDNGAQVDYVYMDWEFYRINHTDDFKIFSRGFNKLNCIIFNWT